ncbi:MAG: nucleotidyltransferase domain-containing protein [Ignavibacteriales bacterium]|nr:nucleotidyltransferase domain-containing protein [Ignavibacteriales bacterium]MCF8438567.1 nucleotidyltransferase domain-containing protein [Ignavibacteriales bacterium]
MVDIPAQIKTIIEEYITILRMNSIPIRNLYLFGSYARGKSNEWSDIDIALVSDVFEGIRVKDKDKIRKLTLSVSSSLEVLPFNPDDFTVENPLAREIIESGIRFV